MGKKFGKDLDRYRKIKLKIGKIEVPLYLVLLFILLFLIIAIVCIIGSKKPKTIQQSGSDNEQTSTISYVLSPLTAEQLHGGSYYVKDGDSFYSVAAGWLYSSKKNDTLIPKKADSQARVLLFGQDDALIPTLYKGDKLIYKSNGGEAIPSDFYLERFKDEGYTIGVRGLTDSNENGKFNTIVTAGLTFYPGSSLAQQCTDIGEGVAITVDKINGKSVTQDAVSSVGTILGLTKGTSYKLDLYGGTIYVPKQAVADIHAMSSFELYDFKNYTMNQDDYAVITLPDYLWSGYYYINGAGLFRYINADKSANLQNINYNIPYFLGTDKHHNDILNPADGGNQDAQYLGENVDLEELESPTDAETSVQNETEEVPDDIQTEETETLQTEAAALTYELCNGEEFNRIAKSLLSEITDITFTNASAPSGVAVSDASASKDNSVVMWSVDTSLFVSTQDAEHKIVANENCLNMFQNDTELLSVNFLSLDTCNVKNMSGMFYGDKKLASILYLKDVENVEDMSAMFAGCKELVNYQFASDWNIEKVTKFDNMCLEAAAHPDFGETLGTWEMNTGTFVRK